MKYLLFLLTGFVMISCAPRDPYHLEAFEVFCEMVASDAKPIAFHYPMDAADVDAAWNRFNEIAEDYEVLLYREDDFPGSMLFPDTGEKSIILIYRDDRLEQYLQWKADAKSDEAREALARRLGRLMGYSPQGINSLLHKNANYQNLALNVVERQVTHLYYEDLQEAFSFYKDVLGMQMVDSTTVQVSADAFLALHPVSDEHPADQPKSTAIAFLTDQLPEWYAHLQQKDVPIKYTYKPRDGGPHDGFVAIDPGGYLLEFEQFKQHPENELFMAVLSDLPRIKASAGAFYGSITWTYHRDVLGMQRFYEEVLGFRLVADQGWTKIYQTSETGFIGLVDERRGMEDYADEKAVEIEWKVQDLAGIINYAQEHWTGFQYTAGSFTGPERYRYHIGVDGEFD